MDKKIYLFCAALAALATFNSCTSDDEIVETTIPEQPVEVKGEPITFTASVNNGNFTRTTVATNLTGFTLWGVKGTSGSEPDFRQAYSYNTTDKVWENEDSPSYETGETPKPFFFYAMALGDGTNATAITFGDNGVSESGTINTLNNTSLLMDATAYNNKSFTYTMPVANGVVDLDKQEDLLVAHSFGPSTDPNGGWTTGTVNLQFEHALSNMEIKIILPLTTWMTGSYNNYSYDGPNAIGAGAFAYIKSIKIYGLKKANTYTFGTGWGNTSVTSNIDSAPIAININNGDGMLLFGTTFSTPTDADKRAAMSDEETGASERFAYEKDDYQAIISSTNSIMAVPQSFTPWALGSIESIPDENPECYVEIEGFIMKDAFQAAADTDWNDEDLATAGIDRIQEITSFISQWGNLNSNTEVDLVKRDNDGDMIVEEIGDYQVMTVLQPLSNVIESSTNENFVKPLTTFYFPFKVKNNTLAPGIRYTLYINLANARGDDGQGALQGVNPN